MAQRTELLKGTLDLLILKTLELEGRHGLGIAERMEQITRGAFSVKPGSLFPALHRLEQSGFIAGQWTANDEGRRVKSYQLTASGRKQLVAEKKQWARVALAVRQILEA
jgi:PadR family transcriptional regulator PadR